MDWITKMNAAIEYVEANLDGEVDLKEAARLANCSPYHFQRVFSYMAGVTMAEYIRRRRLTMAAFALQSGEEKVIDVAVRFGYDSPTAFSRAFQQLHGMPPSEAKNLDKGFVAYPPISFQITVKGVSALNYKIITKESFRIVGFRRTFTMENGENWKAIPAFWGEVAGNGAVMRVAGLINQEPYGVLGVSIGDWQAQQNFDYMIAAATDQPAPEGMAEYIVPALTWAVFECRGAMPQAMQDMERRIMTEWLPASGYDYAKGPDIEVNGRDDPADPNALNWIWMPITTKQ